MVSHTDHSLDLYEVTNDIIALNRRVDDIARLVVAVAEIAYRVHARDSNLSKEQKKAISVVKDNISPLKKVE